MSNAPSGSIASPSEPSRPGAAARLWRWVRWQRAPASGIRIDSPGRETAALVAYAILYVAFAAVTGWLVREHPAPLLGAAKFTDDAWYVLLFKIGGLLVVPLAAMRWRGYRIRDLTPVWPAGASGLVAPAIAFALGCVLNVPYLGRLSAALGSSSPARVGVVLLAGSLVPLLAAAVPEELYFRALLQTRLERVAGRAVAWVGTAVLFTAWHLPTRFLLADGVEGHAGDLGSVLLGTGVPVLLVGLVFGWLWDRYRSPALLVALHWGIDLLPAIASFAGVVR